MRKYLNTILVGCSLMMCTVCQKTIELLISNIENCDQSMLLSLNDTNKSESINETKIAYINILNAMEYFDWIECQKKFN